MYELCYSVKPILNQYSLSLVKLANNSLEYQAAVRTVKGWGKFPTQE
jgi:hypothetical protein